MRITVRLFAGLRERAGTSRLELEDVARIEDVWPRLGSATSRRSPLRREPGLRRAGARARRRRRGRAHPAVSGGSFRLVEGPLDAAAALREVEDPEAGAVASFVGTVRRRSRDRDVLYLEYEAYEEMAEPMLAGSATS